MTNDITIDGLAYRLRPVRVDDAAFIINIRTHPERNKLIHATSPSVPVQEEWLQRIIDRDDEWFFIVERIADGEREGTICLYNHSPETQSAEWGRWVLKEGSLAAPESALLVYRVAFDHLGMHESYGHTDPRNEAVISFHVSCGALDRGIVHGPDEEVWRKQVVTAEMWPEVEPRLQRCADMTRRLLERF